MVSQREFVDPSQAYDRVRENLRRHNITIDDVVLKKMFQALGHATLRVMRFDVPAGADYNDRLKARAVMIFLWLAMGRVPHTESYAQIAASGPGSLSKAHKFTATRQTKLRNQDVAVVYGTSWSLLSDMPSVSVDVLTREFVRTVSRDLWNGEVLVHPQMEYEGAVNHLMNRVFQEQSCSSRDKDGVPKAVYNVLCDYHSM